MQLNNLDERAFFYVYDEPQRGVWVDLHEVIEEGDVLNELLEAGHIGCTEDGDPDFDGDLKVADVEGELVEHFVSKHGEFDFDGYREVAEFLTSTKGRAYTAEIAAAYINHFGSWSQQHFTEAYWGEAKSELDFTYQFVDDIGLFSGVSEEMTRYFDYEKYARDLFINSFVFLDGYVFRNDV